MVAKFGSLPPVSSRNSLSLTDPPNHPLQAGYKFKIGTFPKTELKNRIQRISDKNVFRKHFVFHDIVAAARESNWTEMRHLTQLQSFPFFLFSSSLCLDFFLFCPYKNIMNCCFCWYALNWIRFYCQNSILNKFSNLYLCLLHLFFFTLGKLCRSLHL